MKVQRGTQKSQLRKEAA